MTPVEQLAVTWETRVQRVADDLSRLIENGGHQRKGD